MEENLFFKATKSNSQNETLKNLFYSWIVLLLLIAPIYSNAKAVEQESADEEHTAVIFVSSNTIVYGISQISNAQIINITNVEAQKEPVKAKAKLRTIAQQVKAKISSQELKFKKIQQEVNARTVYSYFIPQDSQSIFFRHSNLNFGQAGLVIAPAKTLGTLPCSQKLLQHLIFRSEKCSSQFSDLIMHFDNLASLSLRGPPLS